MQKLYSEFRATRIVSVQNAQILGIIHGFVVNSADFSLQLIEVTVSGQATIHYLLPQDIRVITTKKVLVDNEEKLSTAEDLVKFTNELKQPYSPIKKQVITESGKKLGKVFDFMFDSEYFFVTKILVKPKGIKKLLLTSLLIDKKYIVETTKKEIIVKDSYIKAKSILPILSSGKKLTASSAQKSFKTPLISEYVKPCRNKYSVSFFGSW